MKVRGDLPPSGAFTVEQQPKKPGYVLARFYENVRSFEEEQDEQTISGYEYDEYHLELADTGDLVGDIEVNYGQYIHEAKLMEVDEEANRHEIAQLRADLDYFSMRTGVEL